ncbi:hypothetical protein MTR_2g026395 [Medicago truncatula]|nr:hypothetical protein MTR_2g026395 [Medicago truncatula]
MFMLWKNKNPGFVKWGSRQWMREKERILKGEKEGLKKMVENPFESEKGVCDESENDDEKPQKEQRCFCSCSSCSCGESKEEPKGY